MLPGLATAIVSPTSPLHMAVQVLGFVGAPFTLASYIIEGGSSKNFAHVKQMAFSNPEVLHALNSKLADSVADYVRYQVSAQLPQQCHGKRQEGHHNSQTACNRGST